MTKTDERYRIWLAGFFDGEGCCSLPKHRLVQWRYPRVTIGQVDQLLILEEIKLIYGGEIYPPGKYNTTDRWILGEGKGVTEFLEDVTPFLRHTVKKQQANILLAIAKLIGDRSEKTLLLRSRLQDLWLELYGDEESLPKVVKKEEIA